MKQESITGRVVPDTYHVDRETLRLRYKRINTKELMVSASGLVPVPKNRRNAVVLRDNAIRDLCQLATGIEDIFGEPAEVEWCILQGGKLMVLEALPIAVGDEILGDEDRDRAHRVEAADEAEEPHETTPPAAPVGEESAPPEEPATGEEPAPPEEPATGEEPAPPEEPATGEEPAPLEEPAIGEEPAPDGEPASRDEAPPTEEPASPPEHRPDWS